MKRRTALATVIVTSFAAAWLAWPSRNQHGNPEMESLISSCRTSEPMTVRLYRGNGGATVAHWYSVTVESDTLGNEKQVLFAYRLPKLQSIECADDKLRIQGEAFSRTIDVLELQRLRNTPEQYWDGTKSHRGIQPSRALSLSVAGILVATGVVVALLAPIINRRRTRNAA